MTHIVCMQDLVESGQLSRHARLLVTGHSLGGALAVLAAMDIKLAMTNFCMEMYTYGTPYPGNRAFAREFEALLPNTWHVIHDGVRPAGAADGNEPPAVQEALRAGSRSREAACPGGTHDRTRAAALAVC